MNKHIAKLIASVIILSSGIIPFSNVQAEKIKTPIKKSNHKLYHLYYKPI
ncbi:hypothetical protein [Bacillus toyonensis]|nr:hypothetical protein [Bacillus toyonensis]